MTEQVSVYSQEAEEAVLGAVIVNPAKFPVVAGFLKPDDFFFVRHNYIWQALCKLDERNEEIEYLSLCNVLNGMGHLELIGGPAYLTQLINTAPSSQHAEIYGRLVERSSTRRHLVTSADDIKRAAMDESLTVAEVMAEVEASLANPRNRAGSGTVQTLVDIAGEYLDDVEKLYKSKNKLTGIDTGIDVLNAMGGGWEAPDFVIIAGTPGTGKTAVMIANILKALSTGNRVTVHSLEMSNKQLLQRMVAQEKGIPVVKQKNPDRATYERIVTGVGELVKAYSKQLFMFDSSGVTPVQMRADCLQISAKHGLDIAFLDYIQLMTDGGLYRGNRSLQVGYFSRSLKLLAKELSVPVIGLSQFSREGAKSGMPQLYHLKDSSSLEQDADEVIILHRDEDKEPDVMNVIMAKNRDGQTGRDATGWDAKIMKPGGKLRRVDLGDLS